MGAQLIQAELLLSCPVRAQNGRRIGRIEEILAQPHGKQLVVEALLVGPYGLLERLSAHRVAVSLRHWLRRPQKYLHFRVRWNQIDLSDPRRPRLRCAVDELEPAKR